MFWSFTVKRKIDDMHFSFIIFIQKTNLFLNDQHELFHDIKQVYVVNSFETEKVAKKISDNVNTLKNRNNKKKTTKSMFSSDTIKTF